ncbi:hypothetical protein EJ08DRAFT_79769 [Tothia fuscella]|uniref:Uncharacterized protein n=1 Tax=Tothia fuscella TaxID=1048955 RepID=A0A9P4NEQ9_9PEZI|nr:hypothetical protein EJ08DRAFT_79769 [Tothia fuscella]
MSGSNNHSRNGSHESSKSSKSSSSGASYQLILEHMLSYPGTYEIPLRTMYTLNCAPRAQPPGPLFTSRSAPPTQPNSPASPSFPYDQQAATAQFTSALMSQISQLPSQPCSLPPAFVTTFLNKCFPKELHLVDFPQSLTALDYLKDLESRRRKDIVYTLARLNIDKSSLGALSGGDDLNVYSQVVADWLRSLESKERKVDSLYTHLYIALRRWILVNEMSLQPFSRHNCHAMLNTLYPPVMTAPPTAKLKVDTLMSQREGYFKYIQTVEKRGIACLQTLMNQGANDDEANGWPAVKRTLDQYLILSNSIIKECADINAIPYDDAVIRPHSIKSHTMEASSSRNGRKVDSGFSFGSDGKHSKTSSTSSSNKSIYAQQPPTPTTPIGRSGSTLERIARELKKIRPKSRVEVTEMIPQRAYEQDLQKENSANETAAPQKSKGVSRLRKMKSLGALGDLKHSNLSVSSLKSVGGVGGVKAAPAFDPYEMKRQREEFERRAAGA